jgi:hypothetical protein
LNTDTKEQTALIRTSAPIPSPSTLITVAARPCPALLSIPRSPQPRIRSTACHARRSVPHFPRPKPSPFPYQTSQRKKRGEKS